MRIGVPLTTFSLARALCLSIVALLVVTLGGCSAGTEKKIKPFISDGCSAFPDGTLSNRTVWRHCCYQHDLSYWPGGSRDERLLADRELASCVADAGFPLTGKLMYAGVRAGGTPYLPTPFRWGFGWPWFHDYSDY